MITTATEIAGLDGGRVSLTPDQIDDLRSRVEGPLMRVGDEGEHISPIPRMA
jgi:hypothetical protein